MCQSKNKNIDFSYYNKHVKEQDEKQSKIIEGFYIDSAKALLNIKRLNGEEVTPIDFDDLDSFPLHEWINVNKKVRIRKTLSTENNLEFDTEMKEGGKFGWHVHNDCSEKVDVIKGKLHDVETGFDYSEGQKAVWMREEQHIPIALTDSLLKVFFFK